MAFDIEGARRAGYSDTEIADHLASQSRFDAASARKSGYSDSDIISHLSQMEPARPQEQAKDTDAPSDAERPGVLSTLARGVGERVGALAGGMAISAGTAGKYVARNGVPLPGPLGLSSIAQNAGERLAERITGRDIPSVPRAGTVPLPAFVQEQIEREANLLQGVGGEMVKGGQLGYEPMTTTEDIKDAWKDGRYLSAASESVKFGLEQGVVSLPDMVAVIANLPAYLAARTGEIAQERASVDGRDEVTDEDMAIAAGTAAISAAMERYGADQVLGLLKNSGKTALRRILGAAFSEAITEAGQEATEYVGERIGQQPMSLGDAAERAAFGALGGGVAGAGIRGTIEAGAKATGYDLSPDARPREDQELEDADFDSAPDGLVPASRRLPGAEPSGTVVVDPSGVARSQTRAESVDVQAEAQRRRDLGLSEVERAVQRRDESAPPTEAQARPGATQNVELYQYQRTANEPAGRQEEVRPLTEWEFRQFVRPVLADNGPATLEEYLEKYPRVTHLRVSKSPKGYKLERVGDLGSVRPSGADVRRVASFDDADAKGFGASQSPEPRRRDPNSVDLENDSLLTAISKLGGLSRDEAIARGVDPAHLSHRGHRISLTFRKNGRGFDHMAEALRELGYPVTDSQGNYDPHVLQDQLDRELAGNPVYAISNSSAIEELERRGAEAPAPMEPTPAAPARPATEDELIQLYESYPDLVETLEPTARLHEPDFYPTDFDEEAKKLVDLGELAMKVDEQRAMDALERAPSDSDAASQLWQIIRESRNAERKPARGQAEPAKGSQLPAQTAGQEASAREEGTRGAAAAERSGTAGIAGLDESEPAEAPIVRPRNGKGATESDVHARIRQALDEAPDGLSELGLMRKFGVPENSDESEAFGIALEQVTPEDSPYTADFIRGRGIVYRRKEAAARDDDGKGAPENNTKRVGDAIEKPQLTQKDIDAAAHEAATSPKNDRPLPSREQMEAENYKAGDPIRLHGHIVRVENPKGSFRTNYSIKEVEEARKNQLGRKARELLEQSIEAYKSGDAKAAVERLRMSAEHVKAGLSGTAQVRDLARNTWANKMPAHYGRILGTEAPDGDHIDVFLGPRAHDESLPAFVIDTRRRDNHELDEYKVMLGYADEAAALDAFGRAYDKGFADKIFMAVTEFSPAEFREWLENGDHQAPAAGKKPVPPERDKQRDLTRIPEATPSGPAPLRAGGKRWTPDRGAIPGEPIAYLDVPEDGDLDDAKAVVVQVELDGREGAHYEAFDREGTLLARDSTADGATREAERIIDGRGERKKAEAASKQTDIEQEDDAKEQASVDRRGALRAKAKDKPIEGGVLLLGDKWVSLEDAVAAAREAIAAGVRPVPFQIASDLNIAMGWVDRVLAAATGKDSNKPKRKSPKQQAAERWAHLRDFFTPGNIVKAYAGHDRVLEFSGIESTGSWRVRVQRVILRDGQWVDEPGEYPRWHSTWPDPGEQPVLRAQAPTDKGKPQVSGNTVFTDDAAEKARALLRKKLGQLNTGLDPEIMQAGITLAGYHIEKGARTFAAYSKAMLEDMGEAVRPYLKSWYLAVRFDPRAFRFVKDMDTAAQVEAAKILEPEAAQKQSESEQKIDDVVAVDAFVRQLTGEGIKSITEARRIYSELAMRKLADSELKRVDEMVELAVVMAARDIVNRGLSPQKTFDELVRLYERQPKLGTRTSTSIENQAYSTPAPLAYLASRLAGISRETSVYEPTAGNGMLLIEANPNRTQANELDPQRYAALQRLGFEGVTQGDALAAKPDQVDVVIANPPFGVVRDEKGDAKRFDAGFYKTGEIDHAIAFRALEAMRDDGSAVLIVGGLNKLFKTRASRSDGYMGSAKRQFYYHLYRSYKVVDHITVAGELYEKQGAGWPVDVIVIRGRGASERALPAADVPEVYSDWNSLKSLLDRRYAENDRLDARDAPEQDSARSGPVRSESADGPSGVSEPARRPDSTDGGSGGRSGRSGKGVRGSSGGAGSLDLFGNTDTSGAGGQSSRVEQPSGPRETGGDRTAAQPEGQGAAGDVVGAATDRRGSGQPAQPPSGLGGPADVSVGQAAYTPTSKANSIGTLVPTNMQTAIRDALEALEDDVGSLDGFVAKELGYDAGSIGDYFSAEQIDALALALKQFREGRGFIIGDQTGIGKGRVVAGVIRWTLRNGMTPIFVTEKANLYADMFRDLTDIGQREIRPLMTNGGETIMLDEEGKHFLKTPGSKQHNGDLAKMAQEADLAEYNMIFTTYSQMQTLKGERTARMDFIEAFAQNGIIIMDESHNAGGNDSGRKRRGDEEASGTAKTGRAEFARRMVGLAKGVFYSSATYAKRPSVMDLYYKTDMVLAVDNNPSKLPGAIEAGGVPLQQVVAAMLTKAGQYVRRERSFAGVEYNTPAVEVDRQSAEKIASVMLAIKGFDDIKKAAVDTLKEDAKRDAKLVSSDGSTGAAGAESTNFTSIMHNLIDQMLLGLKADRAADMAIEALKAGEKPVITVANTMGSFIGEYADDIGLKPGDAISLTFKDLLHRYLVRSRDVTVKDANGHKVRRQLTDEELGSAGVRMYEGIEDWIKEAESLEQVPISPIDWMHFRIRSAGYSSDEITGRNQVIEYREGGRAVYRMRSAAATSPNGRRKVIAAFNRGDTDVVILNQAGSTGLSLHASEKFKDRRRRHMILAQAEKNIDTHMQMLGRVHRTGQIIPPRYSQMVADIPAEKRPAAVLAKKMASLNANTTASRSSQFTSKESVDFLNVYGDKAVASLMADLDDVHRLLGEPLDRSSNAEGYDHEDAARKVTGRIPMLPVKMQEELYDMIETAYREEVARADALGENALEAKTLELDARTVSRVRLFEGQGSSPFAQAAYAEIIDVKRLGKPYTSEKVRELVAEQLDMPKDSPLPALREAGRAKQEELVRSALDEFQKFRDTTELVLIESGAQDRVRTGKLGMLDGLAAIWQDVMTHVYPGASFRMFLDDGTLLHGVVTEVRRKKGVKLPVATGSWVVTFAVADGMRSISLPVSRLAVDMAADTSKVRLKAAASDVFGTPIEQLFDEGQTQSREQRVMVTGNLLAGFGKVKRGQITHYTTSDGRVQQGILMPRNFDMKEFAESQPVLLTDAQVVAFLRKVGNAIVETSDGAVRIINFRDEYAIQTPKSKSEGGRYFLNKSLRDAVGGDFVSVGGGMRALVNERQLLASLKVLRSELDQEILTATYKDEAKSVGGKPAVSLVETVSPSQGANDDDLGVSLHLVDDPSSSASVYPKGWGPDDITGPSEEMIEQHHRRLAFLEKHSRESLQEHVDQIAKRWTGAEGLRVKVVDNEYGLPASIARTIMERGTTGRVGGVMDSRTGVAYILRERHESLQRIEEVLFHEVEGHLSIKQFFGNEIVPFLNRVAMVDPQGVKEVGIEYGFYDSQGKPKHGNEREARLRSADEYVARLAERLNSNSSAKLRKLWSYLVSHFAEWARKAGWHTLRPTEAEIRGWLIRSQRALRSRPRSVDRARASVEAMHEYMKSDPGAADLALHLLSSDASARTGSWLMNELRKGQPIDRIFRKALFPAGYVDDRGHFRVHEFYKDTARRAASTARSAMQSDRFAWLNHMAGVARRNIIEETGLGEISKTAVEAAKRGLIDRYGLSDEYKRRDLQREADSRTIMLEGVDVFENLVKAGVDMKEAEVLYAMLNGQAVDDEKLNALHAPIRMAIDQMGAEAVELGLLSREAYERNKAAGYVHRSYLKHETQVPWAARKTGEMLSARRKRIIGNQFKGRGISMTVDGEALLKHIPSEWWGTQRKKDHADASFLGQKFRVLDQVVQAGEGTATLEGIEAQPVKERVRQRIYWPASVPLPSKFAAWTDRGEFEVASIQGRKVRLRRDYTKQERTRMGEILDARYAIVKTYMLMATDLANGRFFRDIAQNEEWAQKEDPVGNSPTARELSYSVHVGHTWVRVPDSKIPGTNTPRYGAIAGMYVRAEIWNDINELDRMNRPGFLSTIMTQWKLNKTARNPVVHMNNIMSNLLFADMADVRARDLYEGFRSWIEKDEHYQDARRRGAFGADFISQEVRDNVLKPILKELQAEHTLNPNRTTVYHVGMRILSAIRQADQFMRDAYQIEDEIFRMATYMRQLSLGETPESAAHIAREQFLNYDVRAPWVNALRRSVLPFIAYTYRAVPVIARNVYNRPWKLAKYATMGYLLNALSYALDDDGDEEEERRMMREEDQGYTWLGIPQLIRLPFRDRYGQPLFIDVRRWIPAGDVFDFNQANSAIPLPAPLQVGGPFAIAMELAFNHIAFTDEPIYNPLTDTGMERASKVGDFLWKSIMPAAPWIPGSYYWEAIGKANPFGEGARDVLDREYSTPLALVSSVGIKVRPQDPMANALYRSFEFDRRERALDAEIQVTKRQRQRNVISEAEFRDSISVLMEKKRRLHEDKARVLIGAE